MEIKLTAGDKIRVPENCKAIIEDDLIIIKDKRDKFKNGDILSLGVSGDFANTIVIFKEYEDDEFKSFNSHCNNETKNNNSGWSTSRFDYATEYEEQVLLGKLRERGLWWNSETKKLEKFRRRAKKGEKYLSINSTGYIKESVDDYCDWNDEEFDSGNYFLLDERDKAEETAKIIRETYNKRFKHGEERKLFG